MTTPPAPPQWEPPEPPPGPPNWAAPPPETASQQDRPAGRSPRRRRWIIGAVVAVVVVLAVGGVLIAQQQNRAYEMGHAAYLAGDCPAAVGPLEEAAGASDENLAEIARAEQLECDTFLTGDDLSTQGRTGDALLAYSRFLSKYPRSPMASAALANGQATVAEGPPERVASAAVCSELDHLEAQQLVSSAADILPSLLRACGRAFEENGDLAQALMLLNRFRIEYPDHPLRADVDADFVRVTLADAEASGAGELENPGNIGPSGEAGGLVSIEIHNGSAEGLTLVLRGPEVRVEELGPCSECPEVIGEPVGCPDDAPVGRYVLEPGTYDVVVKASSGARVTPYGGTWHFDPGQGYADCFYIRHGL